MVDSTPKTASRSLQTSRSRRQGEWQNHLVPILIAVAAILTIAVVYGVLKGELVQDNAAQYDADALLYRITSVVILALFIPYTAISFIVSRRRVRKRELRELCKALDLNFNRYHAVYHRETRDVHFVYAVGFTFVVTTLGLIAVILGDELGLAKGPNLLLGGSFYEAFASTGAGTGDAIDEHQTGSLMFFGMAFLGAYVWGLQHILHRYFTNDLVPGVYYNLGVRMIFAALISLLFFHLIVGIPGLHLFEEEGDVGRAVLPVVAFMIGFFPQRFLQYITEKISVLSKPDGAAAEEATLFMVQGISVPDKLRLSEAGISSAHDLAQADFTRLLFTTPFGPAQLIDWILQAKLCVLFGEDVKVLRESYIHSISDLKALDDDAISRLAGETKATKTGLQSAHRRARGDTYVALLEVLRSRLGDATPEGLIQADGAKLNGKDKPQQPAAKTKTQETTTKAKAPQPATNPSRRAATKAGPLKQKKRTQGKALGPNGRQRSGPAGRARMGAGAVGHA